MGGIRLRAWAGTTEVLDGRLELAEEIQFSQVYPGGRCEGMTFFVGRDVTKAWGVQVGQRMAAYHGLRMVWEGYVSGITPTVGETRQGMLVICEGAWSRLLQRRRTNKVWADSRIADDVWPERALAGNRKCTINRQGQIRWDPKREEWASGDLAAVEYYAPTGQTIKRVTFSYDLQERAQAWALKLYNFTSSSVEWSHTATGTGSVDQTLGTPATRIELYFEAGATQTPPATDGATAVYGAVSKLVVYTETGAIDGREVAKDILGMVSELSVDEGGIGALTYSLVPFYPNGPSSLADLLARAAGFGDASFNAWGVWVDLSEGSSDGKPRMMLAQRPALTDYDYAVRMDEGNVGGELQFMQDLEPLRNWIGVQYETERGYQAFVTADDDANLKDTASIAAYGQREEWLRLATTSQTNAVNFGRRFLASRKDAQWTAVGQLTLRGWVRAKSGERVAACEIRPGMRIRVENWLSDLSGTGLTFLITGTQYSDADETCALDIGVPNTLEVQLLRLEGA